MDLTRAEIADLMLVLERHIESGEDELTEYFNLIDDQCEDMLINLQSAAQKLKALK